MNAFDLEMTSREKKRFLTGIAQITLPSPMHVFIILFAFVCIPASFPQVQSLREKVPLQAFPGRLS